MPTQAHWEPTGCREGLRQWDQGGKEKCKNLEVPTKRRQGCGYRQASCPNDLWTPTLEKAGSSYMW